MGCRMRVPWLRAAYHALHGGAEGGQSSTHCDLSHCDDGAVQMMPCNSPLTAYAWGMAGPGLVTSRTGTDGVSCRWLLLLLVLFLSRSNVAALDKNADSGDLLDNGRVIR